MATFTPAGKWAPGATHAVVPTTSYFKAGRPRDRTLGVVDFSIFPHLDAFPSNTMPEADRWASDIGGPAYVLDDQSAIKVTTGTTDVVSEGNWKRVLP